MDYKVVPFPAPDKGRWLATLEVYWEASTNKVELRLLDMPAYIIEGQPSPAECLENLAHDMETKGAIQSLRDQAEKLR